MIQDPPIVKGRWRALKDRFVMANQLLVVMCLFMLDVRDLYYKLKWLGPAESYSFRAGSTSYYHEQALVPLLPTPAERIREGVSGWPSFMSRCQELHAMGDNGGIFFLSAMGLNCSIQVSKNQTRIFPQLVMTSNVRVDSLTWAVCSMLFMSSRPAICQNPMVTEFNQRYMLDSNAMRFDDLVLEMSDAEAELLTFLDMLSHAFPISKVICVEAFELPLGSSGEFEALVYGCGSPSEERSEWVGFSGATVHKLQKRMGWLTNDVLNFMGLRYGIRQNTHSQYLIGYEGNKTRLQSKTACNFSSYGQLYAIIVIIDVVLLVAHFLSTYELLRWLVLPQYYEMQEWIRDFETSADDRIKVPKFMRKFSMQRSQRASIVAPTHAPPSNTKTSPKNKRRTALVQVATEGGSVLFEEVQFYSFFSRSFYRNQHYVLLTTITQVLSWLIILPNSVVWTWSDSLVQKIQGYLCSLKSWVLIASALNVVWGLVVKTRERWAYHFTKSTYITNPEIIFIGAMVALALSADIFSMCEKKWNLEGQRTNDLKAFQGGYLAHGNTYNETNDHRSVTNWDVLWILYWPLFKIVMLSIVVIFAVLCVKLIGFRILGWVHKDEERTSVSPTSEHVRQQSRREQGNADGASNQSTGGYKRLALEEALDFPIRANSLIRGTLKMEIVKDGKTYIRPSCYLDFGVMLKNGHVQNRVGFSDIFKPRQGICDEATTAGNNGHHHRQ